MINAREHVAILARLTVHNLFACNGNATAINLSIVMITTIQTLKCNVPYKPSNFESSLNYLLVNVIIYKFSPTDACNFACNS